MNRGLVGVWGFAVAMVMACGSSDDNSNGNNPPADLPNSSGDFPPGVGSKDNSAGPNDSTDVGCECDTDSGVETGSSSSSSSSGSVDPDSGSSSSGGSSGDLIPDAGSVDSDSGTSSSSSSSGSSGTVDQDSGAAVDSGATASDSGSVVDSGDNGDGKGNVPDSGSDGDQDKDDFCTSTAPKTCEQTLFCCMKSCRPEVGDPAHVSCVHTCASNHKICVQARKPKCVKKH